MKLNPGKIKVLSLTHQLACLLVLDRACLPLKDQAPSLEGHRGASDPGCQNIGRGPECQRHLVLDQVDFTRAIHALVTSRLDSYNVLKGYQWNLPLV